MGLMTWSMYVPWGQCFTAGRLCFPLFDDIDHEACQVICRQPVIDRWRQKVGCLSITLPEIAHVRPLFESSVDPIRTSMKSSEISPTGCQAERLYLGEQSATLGSFRRCFGIRHSRLRKGPPSVACLPDLGSTVSLCVIGFLLNLA